jgi:hypothetical protein
MDHAAVFRSAASLVRAGGGVSVVTNGTPLWLQDTGWSRAPDRLPAPSERPAFAADVRQALGPDERFAEQVHVAILTGRILH